MVHLKLQILQQLLVIFSINAAVLLNAQTITTPPGDVTVAAGDTAHMTCQVTGDMGPDTLTWVEQISYPHLGKVIYNSESGVVGPSDKYAVDESQPGSYNLQVLSTELHSAGLYACSLDSTNPFPGHLVVLGEPEQFLPEMIEGQEVAVQCDAEYGGPISDVITPEHKAKLRLYIQRSSGDEILEGGLLVEGPRGNADNEGVYDPYQLSLEVNHTFTAGDNGINMTCEIYTETPAFSVKTTLPLNVKFNVRELEVTPINVYYYPGEVINCTARGNPAPDIYWEALSSPDGADIVDSYQLVITSGMIGDNIWKCVATNVVDGSHSEEKQLNFDVRPAESKANSNLLNIYLLSMQLVLFCTFTMCIR